MKPFTLVLLALLAALQYTLWIAPGGVAEAWSLKQSIVAKEQQLTEIEHKNAVLLADVKGLKHGSEAVEERARNELGMIKEGEVFYQIID